MRGRGEVKQFDHGGDERREDFSLDRLAMPPYRHTDRTTAPRWVQAMPEEPPPTKHPKMAAGYGKLDRYERCWNCAHFLTPSDCELVESPVDPMDTCRFWSGEMSYGRKKRTGFRAGRRKYQDRPWVESEPVTEILATPPYAPGNYLCLTCGEDHDLAVESMSLPACPACGSHRWMAR